jgi:hypothetical protein
MQRHHPAAGAIVGLLLSLAVLAAGVPAQAATSGAGGPTPGAAVFFPEKTFEFQPVIDGTKVIHDFILMNHGSAPLVISDVRTG